MANADHFTTDVAEDLSRIRDAAKQQLELFSSGKCQMHHNGEDVTEQTIIRIKAEIAEFDRLIRQVEGGQDA